MSEELQKRIGANIRKYRELRKLTQKQLAEQCGTVYQHISALERGESNPSASRLDAIAKALDIDPGMLFR